MDGPMPGYVTLVAEVTIDPGTLVARHTHPGIESGYVVSGGLELPIEGQPTRMLKAATAFRCPLQRRMPAPRMATPRRWSSAPMSWKKASRLLRRPDRIDDCNIRHPGRPPVPAVFLIRGDATPAGARHRGRYGMQ